MRIHTHWITVEYVKKKLIWIWDELPILENGKWTLTCLEEGAGVEPGDPTMSEAK